MPATTTSGTAASTYDHDHDLEAIQRLWYVYTRGYLFL